MLFHEIYSSYYFATASILKEAVRGTLTERKLNSLVRELAFGESSLTIPDGLKGGKWKLLRKDMTTPLEKEPSMPLTTLERRWMKTVLLDPRIRLFDPDLTGLEDVQPLFTPDMVVYYDRYVNGDDYTDPVYIGHFKLIMQALRQNTDLCIDFQTKRNKQFREIVTPQYLEYSEKDDRFRLIAAGQKGKWVINVSSITECALIGKSEPAPLCKDVTDTVTFELVDQRKALERVLLHFSHLEKETRRLNENRYRVTIKYDRSDETEMVIRILSFGAVIRVTEPERFAALVRERVERQMALSRLRTK